jgi:flavin-dependent dehydrogenase
MRVAIVGGGPCGAALGLLLAREGGEVTLFDDGRRPQIVVGESLVPAIVPILKRLEIEEETATLGLVKPGVSFNWSPMDRFGFTFARFSPAVPPYAYNIPRPQFDEALLARALAAGVRRVPARARLEAAESGGTELALAPDSLALASWLRGHQPDLIVDATGRSRLAARVLKVPARVGPRDDVAHFAHFEGCQWDEVAGQVVIGRLESGWSWCIPLRDRVSVGVVMGREDAARLGRTPTERLERAIAAEPLLSKVVAGAARVTGVATYSNYQLVSRRGHGPGWVMVGDAFGFVDPMLSPGVFLALRSAELVADVLLPFIRRHVVPFPADIATALDPYAATQMEMLDAWTELVETFYDGRMASMIRAGREWSENGRGPAALKTAAQNHIEKHVALQASGVGTTGKYSQRLVRFLGRYGLRGVKPEDLAIR